MQATDKLWLAKLTTTLQTNIANPNFNNSDLAQALNISERTLHRKVKTLTGLTPLQYTRLQRLQQARVLFQKGNFKTIKEVAFAVGFVNVDYFSQRYEQVFKQRPAIFLTAQNTAFGRNEG